jgi:hypothetical protein
MGTKTMLSILSSKQGAFVSPVQKIVQSLLLPLGKSACFLAGIFRITSNDGRCPAPIIEAVGVCRGLLYDRNDFSPYTSQCCICMAIQN